jgi:DNA repair photolyase
VITHETVEIIETVETEIVEIVETEIVEIEAGAIVHAAAVSDAMNIVQKASALTIKM